MRTALAVKIAGKNADAAAAKAVENVQEANAANASTFANVARAWRHGLRQPLSGS